MTFMPGHVFMNESFPPTFSVLFVNEKQLENLVGNPLGVSTPDWSAPLKLHPWLLGFKTFSDPIG